MKTVIFIIIASLLGLAGGGGVGLFLKPDPPEKEIAGASSAEGNAAEGKAGSPDASKAQAADADAYGDEHLKPAVDETDPDAKRDFAKLEKQFVVPVLTDDRVSALVVLSLAIEIDEGGSDNVFAKEPKLRDAFLQVLFTHAQSQGFDGAFTRERRLDDLRRALLRAAKTILGDMAHDILLTNIVRQDV